MSITVSSPAEWVSNLFPESPTDRQLKDCFNIWWRVVCCSIPSRDPEFEYMKDFGAGNIVPALEHDTLKMSVSTKDGGQHLGFFFPERYITTQEEYMFVPMIKDHPQVKKAKFTIVDIVTKSPLIVGNFMKDDVRIVQREEGDFSGQEAGMGLSIKTHRASKNATTQLSRT